jgi:hypothetical protein
MRGLTGALGLALLLGAQPAWADPGALFLRGEGAEVRLGDGPAVLPATRFACAGCHGADGRGRQEGGTDFPALDWPHLTDPGRAAGPYDEALFLRAVRDGVGVDGRLLSIAMPRYIAEEAVLRDLLGHVKGLGADQRRGIGPASVRLCPEGDAAADAGLSLAAEVVNADGGVFGRRFQVSCKGPAFTGHGELSDRLDLSIAEAEDALAADAGGAVLRLSDLTERGLADGDRLVSLRADLVRPALAANLPPDAYRPYLEALLLAEALLRCGRDVTRACAFEALGEMDVAAYLTIYGVAEGR